MSTADRLQTLDGGGLPSNTTPSTTTVDFRSDADDARRVTLDAIYVCSVLFVIVLAVAIAWAVIKICRRGDGDGGQGASAGTGLPYSVAVSNRLFKERSIEHGAEHKGTKKGGSYLAKEELGSPISCFYHNHGVGHTGLP